MLGSVQRILHDAAKLNANRAFLFGIVALAYDYRGTLWKFQPHPEAK